jgi:hypothetical protein
MDPRFLLRRQEELTAQVVFALLLSEGHDVVDVGRPRQSGGRSPDFVFRLDGQAVALEVVRYLEPSEAQKALSRVNLVERALQDRLNPEAMGLDRTIAISVRYSVAALQAHKRRDVDLDADQLAAGVRAVMAATTASAVDMVEVSTSIPWIEDLQVSLLPAQNRAHTS